MRVTSSLADIEFDVGAIRIEGDDLVVESGAGSTLATTVRIGRAEARRVARVLLGQGATWRFLGRMLTGKGKAAKPQGGEAERWAERRRRTGLNKPW